MKATRAPFMNTLPSRQPLLRSVIALALFGCVSCAAQAQGVPTQLSDLQSRYQSSPVEICLAREGQSIELD